MEDLVENVTRGNVSGVKIVLATVVLALAVYQVLAVRWWHALGRYLPAIGLTIFGLLALTWATSAGDYFFGG